MRTLLKNKQDFQYANYMGQDEILDENGLGTGQYRPKYGERISARANVSAARGNVSIQEFGENLLYDKTIAFDNCPLNEESVLWVDDLTSDAHDYVVVRIAKSLNSTLVAIRKVDVSA